MTNIFNNINKNMSVSNKKDNTVVKKVNDVENKISDKEKPIKFIQAPEVKMTFANLNDGTKYKYTSRYVKGFNTLYGKTHQKDKDLNIRIGEGIDGIAQNYYTNGNVKFAGSDGPKNSWVSISVDERDYFIEKGWLEIMEDFYKKLDKTIVKITVSRLDKETPNAFAERIKKGINKLNTAFNSDKKYYSGLATPYTYATKKLDIYCTVPAGQLKYMIDFAYKLNAKELYLLQKMDNNKSFVEPTKIAGLVNKIIAE